MRNTYNATFPLFSKVATYSRILEDVLVCGVVLRKIGLLGSAATCLTMRCAGGCEWAECTPSVALPAGPSARQPWVPNHNRLELQQVSTLRPAAQLYPDGICENYLLATTIEMNRRHEYTSSLAGDMSYRVQASCGATRLKANVTYGRFVVSKLGFPLVRYPLTFDDEDLEGIEGWIQCVFTD